MTNPEITKANTVESFMKANSTLRVGKDAVTDFLTRLNTLSAAVIKAAETSALNQNRKTIMATDIEQAMTSVTGNTSDLPFLFKQIEKLNARDTADLAALIRAWVDSH
jgi:histone H3/H4